MCNCVVFDGKVNIGRAAKAKKAKEMSGLPWPHGVLAGCLEQRQERVDAVDHWDDHRTDVELVLVGVDQHPCGGGWSGCAGNHS